VYTVEGAVARHPERSQADGGRGARSGERHPAHDVARLALPRRPVPHGRRALSAL